MEFKVVDLCENVLHKSGSIKEVWVFLNGSADPKEIKRLSVKEYDKNGLSDACGASFILNKFKSEKLIPNNVYISEL